MAGENSIAPFAAAVYTAQTADRLALLKFVERLQARDLRVGGILQEARYDANGAVSGLDAIEVHSARRIPISRPQKNDDECGLDVAALAETSGIIRRAIDERVDLVVVEKYGEQEQAGKGLIDEILQTIAAGIPLLIAVPAAALPLWQEVSGELGGVIDFDETAFDNWWRQVDPGTGRNES